MFNDVWPSEDFNTTKNIFEEFNEQNCPLGRADRPSSGTGRHRPNYRRSNDYRWRKRR
jgi:hypothetical protein